MSKITTLCFLIFITLFNSLAQAAEIRSQTKDLIEIPRNCVAESVFPCAVQADGKKVSMSFDSLQIVLSANSVLQLESDRMVKIVTGHVYLQKTTQDQVELEVVSEFGRIYLGEESHLFLKKTAQALEIYPLKKGVHVVPLGSSETQKLFLPVGYRSHLAAVTEARQAFYEIPTSANLKGLVSHWGPLFPGSANELTSFLAEYRSHWLEAAQSGAIMQQAWAERELASAKDQVAREQERQRRAKIEQDQLRQLFRSKNYLQ